MDILAKPYGSVWLDEDKTLMNDSTMAVEAWRAGDATLLEQARGLKRRFLDLQFGRWVAPFTATMRSNAQTGYYRQLADLTEKFVTQEAARG